MEKWFGVVTGSISMLMVGTGVDDDIFDVLRASTASDAVISNSFSAGTSEQLTHQQNFKKLLNKVDVIKYH